MKRYIAMIAIAASLLVGCAAPATSGPATAAPADSVSFAEDDPGWNCHTMGNKICGIDPWDSFDVDMIPADVVSQGFKAEYVGMFDPTTLPSDLVGMPSTSASGVLYAFKVEAL